MSNTEHFKKYSIVHAGFRANIDLSAYGGRFDKAQWYLASRVIEDSKPYMPILTGNMRQRTHMEDGGKRVVYPGPQGRFQYYGKVMVDPDTGSPWAREGAEKVLTERQLNYSDPNAVSEWFEHAKQLHGQYWIEGVKDIITGK